MTEEQQLFQCRLCDNSYPNSEMSEEHYPARNTGNEDLKGQLEHYAEAVIRS